MYIFIVNPIAGNGRAKRVYNQIKKSNLFLSLDRKVFITEYKGHAEKMIATFLKNDLNQIHSIIVIGGDGTLHEVINGLKHNRLPISFIPGGSGNDFARGCSIKNKPLTILEQIIAGHGNLPYWVGNYRIDEEKRAFVNSIGFGFDAEVAKKANESRYKRWLNGVRLGTLSYLIALLHVLFTFKPMKMELEINGSKRLIKNCWMITISNHPYYGGGMKIIPNTKIQPNIFPVLIIHSISKWKILALFMTVFTGKHLSFKEVELVYTTKVNVFSYQDVYFHADGEIGNCRSCVISKQHQSIQIGGTNHEQ